MEKQKNKERDLLKKAFLFLLLVGFSCLSVWSQNRGDYVTMTVKSERLTDVIREIEKATDYKIIFAFDDVQQYRVSATLDNVSAPKALRILLAGKPLSFTVDGKYIRVFEDKSKGISQTGFFKGKVVDTDGSPLPGVSVKIKGSNLGTITNLDGVFNIDAHGEDTQTFVFTFLGKKSVERKFKSGDGQVIKMIDDVNTFDDVVVTGYQTVSKRELASAISTVKAKDVMVDGAASIDQMLQGRVPGMAVINTSGEPSATPKIRIRGNATINGNKSPVWVVDGVIQEQDIPFSAASINSEDAEYLIGNAISGLNPQDIETITVLKDASATAIYGVKAANGVIIITTKRGYSGKPVITYNGDVTLNTRPSYDNYNLMNSQERVAFSKSLVDAGMEAGRTPVGETYEGAYEDLLSKASTLDEFKQRVAAMQTRNTDWFKYLFRNSVTTTHTANISGGSDKVRYYMSAGYSDIQGSSKASDEQKFNVLGRIDAEINSHINFQAKFNYSNVSNKGYKSSVNPFDYAYSTSRTLPVYNEDGSYYMNYAKGGYSGTKNIGYNVLKELENTASHRRWITLMPSSV
jgi:TonB-linked SusC/RagA family outer membrane protein